MKKILITGLAVSILFLFSDNASAGNLWITKIGANTNGYLNYIPDSVPPGIPFGDNVYGGCVISVEQLFELSERLELGYGMEIQFAGSVNINEYMKGIPVFLSLYYHPNGVDGKDYYILGRIGFNFDGYYGFSYYYYSYYSLRDPLIYGFYYAVGAGIQLSEYPVIRLEGFFSGNNGTYYCSSPSGYSAYVKYTKFTVAVGFGVGY